MLINGANSSSSTLIRLRLEVLSTPIRVNEAKLKVRLKLNEGGKKDLIITNYIPIIGLGKYYTNEKINTKKFDFIDICHGINA